MQTPEIVRSSILCMESYPPDDPRCLAAAQELYNMVSGLSAKEIRALCCIGNNDYNNSSSTGRSQSTTTNNTTSNSRNPSQLPNQQQGGSSSRSQSHTQQQQHQQAGVPRSSSVATATSTATATDTNNNTTNQQLQQQQQTEQLLSSLPSHLVGFAAEAAPPLHIRTLIQLTSRCYSGVAGFQHPSSTVEHVAQVTLVTLRLCVTADAISHDNHKDIQMLGELAMQLGAGRTGSTPVDSAASKQQPHHHHDPATESKTSRSASAQSHNNSRSNSFLSAVASKQPGISSVSVLAAIELFLVSLYNNRIGPQIADATLNAASRHWLSAWLVRIEDGSASQPIEIFHRLCCFQRIVTLRPAAASACFTSHGFHERLINFVCGEGAAVHASSIGLALHLLAQLVEHGPENMMLKFVSPKLIELHIASWTASEWTETLEGAFVLLTACVRLGLAPEMWQCIVRANLHLIAAHSVSSPSVRVAAAAATCLRTMLFLCQRELDIGLSVFFDTLAAPNLFKVLEQGPSMSSTYRHNNNNSSNNNNNTQSQQQDLTTGIRILSTECALIVAVFASFSPQHKVAAHHVANKLHFPLALQRALLIVQNDADLSLFVNWTLYDEAGRPISGVNDDQQFNQLLKNRPLSSPPPGVTPQEWTEAAYVKFSLQKALQPPTESDVASIFGFLTFSNQPQHSSSHINNSTTFFPTNPRPPALGSKELSLALLKWFSTPLQIVAATESKTSAAAHPVPTYHHHNHSDKNHVIRFGEDQEDDDQQQGDEEDLVYSSKDHFESCVNLILRFSKCAPVASNNNNNQQQSPIKILKDRKQQNTSHHNQSAISLRTNNTTAAATTAGRKTSVGSILGSSSNNQKIRRTHLFSHPYVDYYQNAQKKNAYTPNPVVPPQVRRWGLEDVQKGDLFSFKIRLDGLEHLTQKCVNYLNKLEQEARQKDQQQQKALNDSSNATSSVSSPLTNQQQQKNLLHLHREEGTTTNPSSSSRKRSDNKNDEFDLDAEEYDEEYEEEVEEEVEEEFEIDEEDEEQQPKKKTSATVVASKQQTNKSAPPSVVTTSTTNKTPSVVPPSEAIPIGSAIKNNNTINRQLFNATGNAANSRGQSQQSHASSSVLNNTTLEFEKESYHRLQERVTTLVADALHRAELHLLKMNEQCQMCPTKLLNRRAFLVDMINNVMPAVISMLTMLFSVAKRAPAAVVKVARRVERAENAQREGSTLYATSSAAANNSNIDDATSRMMIENHSTVSNNTTGGGGGSISIHPGNLCAICFQLEMEMAWY